MKPPPDLAGLSLAEIARLAAEQKLPPVDQWNPAHCGHSGMRIDRDGTWFHEGSPIGRIEMVRLFASVLRREADGRHVLVTPVEKLDIDVEDAPFVAVTLQSEAKGRERRLAFQLNTGDLVVAGPDHPIILRDDESGPRPYLMVRGGMEARIARSVYYELAAMALADEGAEAGADGGEAPGVWSDGRWFPMTPAGD